MNSIISQLNTEDYWSLGFGLFWFCVLVTIRVSTDIGPTDLVTWKADNEFVQQMNTNIAITLLCIIGLLTISLIICHRSLGKRISVFNYFIIISIVIASKIVGTFFPLKSNGFGTSFWCIVFGCFYRFILGDSLLQNVMSMEFFIKVGIVLFAIDIQNLVNLGPKAIIIAWIETSLLLIFVYFLGTRLLKLDTKLCLLISSGLSVCGSSAIMTLSDIIYKKIDQNENSIQEQQQLEQEQLQQQQLQQEQLEQEQLEQQKNDTHISITILSIFSIPFIPLMPLICRIYGFSDVISGLWIGGTIDSTGTVIASVSLLGSNSSNSAIILKMLQNLLIGPLALIVTVIWHRSFKPYVLWDKFPKFIIGFIIVSVVVSSLQSSLRTKLSSDCFIISEWFSAISFVLIGLDIDLYNHNVGKNFQLVVLYLVGQTVDVFTTFGFAYLLFG